MTLSGTVIVLRPEFIFHGDLEDKTIAARLRRRSGTIRTKQILQGGALFLRQSRVISFAAPF